MHLGCSSRTWTGIRDDVTQRISDVTSNSYSRPTTAPPYASQDHIVDYINFIFLISFNNQIFGFYNHFFNFFMIKKNKQIILTSISIQYEPFFLNDFWIVYYNSWSSYNTWPIEFNMTFLSLNSHISDKYSLNFFWSHYWMASW